MENPLETSNSPNESLNPWASDDGTRSVDFAVGGSEEVIHFGRREEEASGAIPKDPKERAIESHLLCH